MDKDIVTDTEELTFERVCRARAKQALQLYKDAKDHNNYDLALDALKLAWRMEDRAAGRNSLEDYA